MRFWTMERRIILFLVFKVFMQSIHGQSPILDIDNDSTDEGSSFTLNCSVAISDAITFKLDNVAQGSCGAPFLGVLGSCTPNIITQSLADEVTSWTIAPAQIAHRGSWKCTLGTTESNVVTLTIHKLPVAVLEQNGISSDTTVNDTSSYPISVEVDCLFSENGPTVKLEFFAAGTVNASVIMSCSISSTTCSACTGCSAYNCSHTISLNQALSSGQITKDTPYTLQITVGVTGTTQTFSTAIFSPHSIKFESTSKTTDSPETPKTTVIVVVACVVPVIIIVIGIGGLMLFCQKKKRDARKTQGDGLVPTGPEEKQNINDQKGMPLEPEGPLKIKTRQDHVEFQWKPPKSNGGSEITEYIVEVNGIKFDTWETFAKSSSMKLQVPMEKFKDGKVMSFRVRAENENGLSEPLLAQKPFTLQNSHDLLSNRPVVTNQGRGHDGESSLLEKVPIDRTLPKPV